MEALTRIASGLAGACAVTAVHQLANKAGVPHAPRVDVVGRRAIAGPLAMLGIDPPKGKSLHDAALALDIASNTLYYAAVAKNDGRHAWRRGLVLGLLAGIGAVVLPPALRLGSKPTSRTPATQLMTVAWYTLGGLVAAATARTLAEGE
ncbi:MAG TPA: hypothetical protein VK324_01410 [Tepidisphaeraceae bacterium]|nr:hypothetical protein [Tepidisphaeraceae bacterium]